MFGNSYWVHSKNSVKMKIFCLTFLLISTTLAGMKMPTFKIKVLSAELCDLEGGAEGFPIEFELKDIGNGLLAADATITLLQDFTDEYTFRMKIKQWVDGKWQDANEIEGNFWERVQDYLPRVFAKLSKQMEPNLPDEPPFGANTYTVKGFEIAHDDLDLPAMLQGKMNVFVYIYSDEDRQNNVACLSCVVDTKM